MTMQRDTALSEVEDMAYKAVCQMRDLIEKEEQPISPLYIKALKDLHSMLAAGLKANPLNDENLEPEELLAKLTEMSERLRRKIARKNEMEEECSVLPSLPKPPRRLDA